MKIPISRPLRTLLLLVLLMPGCDSSIAPVPDEGTWRLVNYWAAWCSPCREEIPELNEFNNTTNVVVLGVNYDGVKGDALTELLRDFDIRFDNLDEDPAKALGISRPRVLPTTLVLDPADNVVGTLTGPQTQESLREFLSRHGWSDKKNAG
ncbi:MAG: TlpA disulfide reductase family protein [Halieaceae bacterium]